MTDFPAFDPDRTAPERLAEEKARLRRAALGRRRAQPDPTATSRAIGLRLAALHVYESAGCVLLYVSARSEVQTQPLLRDAWARGKKVVVPYCEGDQLELFHLMQLDELELGRFGILEPRVGLRAARAQCVSAAEIELAVVPGVAFSRLGARLGHGHGYYDRLLARLPRQATVVGLAFECQMVDNLPLAGHDVPMDLVVTEAALYRRPGRSNAAE